MGEALIDLPNSPIPLEIQQEIHESLWWWDGKEGPEVEYTIRGKNLYLYQIVRRKRQKTKIPMARCSYDDVKDYWNLFWHDGNKYRDFPLPVSEKCISDLLHEQVLKNRLGVFWIHR